MKILIIMKFIPDFSTHLKSDLVYSTIRSQLLHEHNVTLLSTGTIESKEFEIVPLFFSKIQKFLYKINCKINPILGEKYLAKLVSQKVSKNNYDIILAECLDRVPAIHAKAIKDRIGIPFIVREHQTHYDRFYNKASDLPRHHLNALREADAVCAVSKPLANRLTDLRIRETVSVVPNSLQDDFYLKPDQGKFAFQEWASDAFLFGAWTKWREIKRIDLLLKAFSQVHAQHPDTKLIILGPIYPESNRAWANAFIESNGLDGVVWLFGSATRSEVHAVAHLVDCCVIPSDHETFGLPALEAMAAGAPSVVTACNGPESLIDEASLGRVVEKGNANAIANAMADVYSHHALFEPEYIRGVARERYSEKAVGEQFTRLYEEVCGQK